MPGSPGDREAPATGPAPTAAFEFVDAVTSDLRFAVRGPDLASVFRAAADALLAATVADPGSVRSRLEQPLALSDRRLDLLLLRFVNELIFLRDARGLLLRAREVRVCCDGGVSLETQLAGEPFDRARHEPGADVKAATAHGLALRRGAEGWEASVTLDV